MDDQKNNESKLGRPPKKRIERNRNTVGKFSSNKERNVDNNKITSIEDDSMCFDVPVRTEKPNTYINANNR